MAGRSRRPARAAESTPYDTLGIEPGVSYGEIRKAYLRKVRESPPETDPAEFQKVRRAYEELKDGERKRKLDLSLVRRNLERNPPRHEPLDAVELFRRRALQLLTAGSDLYVKDFSSRYGEVDELIRNLR